MGFKLIEEREQGLFVEDWQVFYLKYTDGQLVSYLQKDGNNGIEQSFNLNSKDNFPSYDDIEFDISNPLLIELVEFVDDNFELFMI
jgi:hypothetical protein